MAENPFRSDPEFDPNQPNCQHKDYLVHAIYMVAAVFLGLLCAACAIAPTSTIAGTVVCVFVTLLMFVAVRHYPLYRQGREQYRANHPYVDSKDR